MELWLCSLFIFNIEIWVEWSVKNKLKWELESNSDYYYNDHHFHDRLRCGRCGKNSIADFMSSFETFTGCWETFFCLLFIRNNFSPRGGYVNFRLLERQQRIFNLVEVTRPCFKVYLRDKISCYRFSFLSLLKSFSRSWAELSRLKETSSPELEWRTEKQRTEKKLLFIKRLSLVDISTLQRSID